MEPTVQLLLALITGGVGTKVLDLIFTRGRSRRDEWRADFEALDKRYQAEIARVEARSRAEVERLEARSKAEIARLEAHIKGQDDRIDRLERENEEWERKFYDELKQRQMLEVVVAAKDQLIETLQKELEKWETSARTVYRTVMSPPPEEQKETTSNE